jgi:hypothetical protein
MPKPPPYYRRTTAGLVHVQAALCDEEGEALTGKEPPRRNVVEPAYARTEDEREFVLLYRALADAEFESGPHALNIAMEAQVLGKRFRPGAAPWYPQYPSPRGRDMEFLCEGLSLAPAKRLQDLFWHTLHYGFLPQDIRGLARVCKLPPSWFERSWPQIEGRVPPHPGLQGARCVPLGFTLWSEAWQRRAATCSG